LGVPELTGKKQVKKIFAVMTWGEEVNLYGGGNKGGITQRPGEDQKATGGTWCREMAKPNKLKTKTETYHEKANNMGKNHVVCGKKVDLKVVKEKDKKKNSAGAGDHNKKKKL